MTKIIRYLAIVAAICFIGFLGLLQEVLQEEPPAVQATQTTEGTVIHLAPGRGYWP